MAQGVGHVVRISFVAVARRRNQRPARHAQCPMGQPRTEAMHKCPCSRSFAFSVRSTTALASIPSFSVGCLLAAEVEAQPATGMDHRLHKQSDRHHGQRRALHATPVFLSSHLVAKDKTWMPKNRPSTEEPTQQPRKPHITPRNKRIQLSNSNTNLLTVGLVIRSL